METFTVKNIKYTFNTDKNTVTVQAGKKVWEQRDGSTGIILKNAEDKTVLCPFDKAKEKTVSLYEDGISYGMRCDYRGFELDGDVKDYAFTTLIWVHKTTARLYFELVPINEPGETCWVDWPAAFKFDRKDAKSYTLFPQSQGILIPSNHPYDVRCLGRGTFTETYSCMPWYAQIDEGNAYLAIVTTRYDAEYVLRHKGDEEEGTLVRPVWHASLGKINYRRVLRVEFFENADHVTVCKAYRQYVKEKGDLLTLRQKAIANPRINELFGSSIIHTGTYYDIDPQSVYYNKENPEKNKFLKTFEQTRQQVLALVDKGLKKGYMHVDGWGAQGYDRNHPDVVPPCEYAGGIEGLRALYQTCQDSHIIMAIHDQYRDYYTSAATFDEKNSKILADGRIPHEHTWFGGEQQYLCPALHVDYINRNYDMLEAMGFKPDGVYLDVYAAASLDECASPFHRVTKKECAEERRRSLAALAARGIIMSSECSVDEYLPQMVLCHHAPYMKSLDWAEGHDKVVCVPLVNLVYHDCFITPWTVKAGYESPGEMIEGQFLDALLNGGPAYLCIEADEAELKKHEVINALNEKVACKEMINHEFLADDYSIQRTTFEGGVTVTVNYNDGTYQIEG